MRGGAVKSPILTGCNMAGAIVRKMLITERLQASWVVIKITCIYMKINNLNIKVKSI